MNLLPEPELVLHGGKPITQQIKDQVRDSITLGLLRPGEELPSVRAVAAELAINPHAVTKAFGELEKEGFLDSGDGSGTFVRSPLPGRPDQAELQRLCGELLARARERGFSPEAVLNTTLALVQRR